jgi:hypothetical protein
LRKVGWVERQVRRAEQEITASYTEAAGEDPLAGRL